MATTRQETLAATRIVVRRLQGHPTAREKLEIANALDVLRSRLEEGSLQQPPLDKEPHRRRQLLKGIASG